MQRSKTLAVIFLLGTLIVGGAIGFTADRLWVHDFCSNRPDRKAMRAYLAKQLALTTSQRTSVDSILDQRHRDMSAILAPLRPQLDSIRDHARAEILKLLDASQRQRFQQIIEESKREEALDTK